MRSVCVVREIINIIIIRHQTCHCSGTIEEGRRREGEREKSSISKVIMQFCQWKLFDYKYGVHYSNSEIVAEVVVW